MPPLGHAPHRLEEVGDVHDPVLEQVADAAAAVGQQLLGVGLLDILRDHEHRRSRNLPPDLERGAQALVAVAGRQADVDDREVGPQRHDLAHQRLAIGDGGDHLDLVVAQQPGEPVAQQRQVLGNDYAHGSSA